MAIFTFNARQGQANSIAALIVGRFNLIVSMGKGQRSSGGKGTMVRAELPAGLSKRTVDRFLKSSNVPGAVSRRNRFRILRVESWDKWKIADKIGCGNPFIIAENGKLRKVVLRYIDYGCTCCGGYYELEDVK